MYVERVSVTDSAKKVLDKLKRAHGELIFHQSGGCCDGSVPMCFKKDEFLIGSNDVCLGEIHGCKFYMSSDQFEYYKNMHLTLDATEGRGSGFSLEISIGFRFITVSRVLTDAEVKNLRPIET